MWQTDFKGEFLLNNDVYCFTFDIIDDCTRFAIKINPFASTANAVVSIFEEAFRGFGLITEHSLQDSDRASRSMKSG